MRRLGISALVLLAATALADFGPPAQLAHESAPYVAVAATAAGPVVVWRGDAGVVRANGHLVAPSGSRVAAASIGELALVVWTQPDGLVMAARRAADGRAAGVPRHIASNAAGPVAVAAGLGRYFVAWADTNGAVSAAIVSTAGDPLVPAMPVTTQSSAQIAEDRGRGERGRICGRVARLRRARGLRGDGPRERRARVDDAADRQRSRRVP